MAESELEFPVARCNCLTKTPDPAYHEKTCPVWMYFYALGLECKLNQRSWKSVQDERPEIGKSVLVRCREDYIQEARHTDVIEYDDGPAYIFISLVTDEFISVTDWMEIPE